ncbi:MAG: glycosyltransferase family 4 protein [Anaerolineae bacterium]
MRVLVLNYEFPPIGGGGGAVSKAIACHLVQLGAEVQVLTAHWGDLPRVEEIDGYTVHRTLSLRQYPDRCRVREMFSYFVLSILPALRLARRWQPDIVHAHFAVPVGPLGYLIKKLLDIPYIITLHGGDVPGFDDPQTEQWYRLLLPLTRPIWKNAAAIVAVGQGLRDLAKDAYPDVPVSIIRNGIDCATYRPPTRERSDDRESTLVFVGRIVKQKGLSYLIRGLPELRRRVSKSFKLNIVGDGPLRPELESLVAELGVGDCVNFVGWVSQEEVRRYLHEADIFVLPSLMEGLSIALLQAMASGLPLVTSDAVGNRDVVHHDENGFVVPARDVGALIAALAVLVDDADLQKRMGEASLRLSEPYDWSVISQTYFQLLKRHAK